LAAAVGHQLMAERRSTDRLGLGHRRQNPHRLASIAILKSPEGQRLVRERVAIERSFGNCTSFGGGLGPLPSWVRRDSRLQQWVQAKLLINAVRILEIDRKLMRALA
jgi:hypothetical protein